MSFYKRDNEELLVAPNFVRGPGFDLFAESHAEHTYPVDGWYWFDNLDAAMAALQTPTNILTISPVQAKIALHRAGLLTAVESMIAAADIETQLAWSEATSFNRNSPILTSMAAALGLSETQLDNLFTTALTIQV